MSQPTTALDRRATQTITVLGYDLLPTGLRVKAARMPFDEWTALGMWLKLTVTALQWWVGDWLTFGEREYGEAHAQALDAIGWDPATVLQYAWVCRQVAPDERRDDLTFFHHREVAALDPAGQRAWLARAAEGGWSVERLRRELKQTTRPGVVRFWVLVECRDAADQEAVLARFLGEGRAAKAVERLTAKGERR